MQVIGETTYLPVLDENWRWRMELDNQGGFNLYAQRRYKEYYSFADGFYWVDSETSVHVGTVDAAGKTAEEISTLLRERAEQTMAWGPWSPTTVEKLVAVNKALFPPTD